MTESSPDIEKLSSRPTAISTTLRMDERRWIESGHGVRTKADILMEWGWRAQAKENQTAPSS